MLLHIDGFDGYGTTPGAAPIGLEQRYASVGAVSAMDIEAGRIGGQSLELGGTGCHIETHPLTTNPTMIIGFGYLVQATAIAAQFLEYKDGATLGMNLRFLPGQQFEIRRGSTVLQTVDAIIGLGNWAFLEFKAVCHSSTGSYELKLRGQTIAQASGVNTQAGSNAFHDRWRLSGINSSGQLIDDLYCLDGSGSLNNNFLGNRKVLTSFPTSDVSKQFTPSSGPDNFALQDDNPPNDDTDHVESNTVGNKDLYGYGDVSGVASIDGLSVTSVVKNTSGTTHNLKTVVKSGGTESADAGQAVGSSYTAKSRILETDPNTSAAWSQAGVNAAQFGIEVG